MAIWAASAGTCQAELSVRWSATFGDSSQIESATDIVRVPASGDLWVASETATPRPPSSDGVQILDETGLLSHLSADGHVLSRSQLPTGYVLEDLMLADDGSLYAVGVGDVEPFSRWVREPFVAKLSADGSISWLRSLSQWIMYPGETSGVISDGSIYVVGSLAEGYGYGMGVVKVPMNGDPPSEFARLAGGGLSPTGIAVAPDRSIVAIGRASGGLPVIDGLEGPQGQLDAYVARFSSLDGSQTYGTYLGGSNADLPTAVAVGRDDGIYLTGATDSLDFDSKRPIDSDLPRKGAGLRDAFITKIAPGGRSLEYSTTIGGLGAESGEDIVVTDDGSAVVAGNQPGGGFPLVGSDLAVGNDNVNQFIFRVAPRGASLSLSTRFGGSLQDGASALTVDEGGDIWTAGTSGSPDLPRLIEPGPSGPAPETMVASFAYKPEVVDPVVKAKPRQQQGSKTISVGLRVGAAEAVRARITGTILVGGKERSLEAVARAVPFAGFKKARLRVPRPQSRDLLRRLRAGEEGSAVIKVKLRDGDGDTATRSVKVRLR